MEEQNQQSPQSKIDPGKHYSTLGKLMEADKNCNLALANPERAEWHINCARSFLKSAMEDLEALRRIYRD